VDRVRPFLGDGLDLAGAADEERLKKSSLPSQHRELMAQRHDLDVLGPIGSAE
jgi:hypothetical protein